MTPTRFPAITLAKAGLLPPTRLLDEVIKRPDWPLPRPLEKLRPLTGSVDVPRKFPKSQFPSAFAPEISIPLALEVHDLQAGNHRVPGQKRRGRWQHRHRRANRRDGRSTCALSVFTFSRRVGRGPSLTVTVDVDGMRDRRQVPTWAGSSDVQPREWRIRSSPARRCPAYLITWACSRLKSPTARVPLVSLIASRSEIVASARLFSSRAVVTKIVARSWRRSIASI